MNMIKYVMIDGVFPIIFQGKFNHSDFQHLGQVTSAGFISDNLTSCYGKSITLKIDSDPEDIKIIRRFLEIGK